MGLHGEPARNREPRTRSATLTKAMVIHGTAARGYETAGADYERSRPSYPPEVVDVFSEELDLRPGKTIVDLAAGTGKLTRLLEDIGTTLVAVEPVTGMVAHLRRKATAAHPVAGAAERLPLRSGCVDAVVVGMAFHWFDGDRALAEIHRVLRPQGGIGLVWNNPDRNVQWVADVWGLVDEHRNEAPSNRDLSWQAAFARANRFSPLMHRRFAHGEWFCLDDLLTRVASISFIAELPSAQREAFLKRVRDVAVDHPDLRGRERFVMPYVTDVYWCSKR